MANVPMLVAEKKNCCGCTLCSQICPKSAIVMKKDEEGFLYPSIDESLCIGCNKCVSVCGFKNFKAENDMEAEFYVCGLKDEGEIKKSSSGGMFTALSDVVLEEGGAIACSIYDYDTHTLNFQLVTEKAERNRARGSKYLQSNPNNIFSECEIWLNENPDKILLFIGTGCQADAFKNYSDAKKIRDRVYIVDLICHGSPSPEVWKNYVEYLSESNSVVIDKVDFKDKRNGWGKPTAIVKSGEKEYSLNEFLRLFHQNYIIRPSCYNCPYATVDRNTDITIGDFWGVEKKVPEFPAYWGSSISIVQSKKGKALFDKAKGSMNVVRTEREKCLQENLLGPSKMPKDREAFWNDYNNSGAGFAISKYGKLSFMDKLKSKVKKMLMKIK